jgi:hypothetical protein
MRLQLVTSIAPPGQAEQEMIVETQPNLYLAELGASRTYFQFSSCIVKYAFQKEYGIVPAHDT